MAEFWALTPQETYAVVDAWKWRQEQAERRDMRLAWHIAALTRTKRLPRLQRLLTPMKETKPLEGEELEKRRQERDEMLKGLDLEKLNETMRKRKT